MMDRGQKKGRKRKKGGTFKTPLKKEKEWHIRARLFINAIIGRYGTPCHAATLKPYKGSNVLRLTIAALKKDYRDPRWISRQQAEARGWHIKEGEEGVNIKFWSGNAIKNGCSLRRNYIVFNAAQITGIEPLRVYK
jgi:antirestriction protein ArdC